MEMDKDARWVGQMMQRLWGGALAGQRDAWRLLAYVAGPCVAPSARRYIELLGEAGLDEAAWPVAGLLQAAEGPRSIDWGAVARYLCADHSYDEARRVLEDDDPPAWALWCEYWREAVDDGPTELPPMSMAIEMAEVVIDQLERRLWSDVHLQTDGGVRRTQLYVARLSPIWVLAGSVGAAYATAHEALSATSLPRMQRVTSLDGIEGHEGEPVQVAELPDEQRVSVADALRMVGGAL